SRVDVRRDVLQSDDVPEVLRDALDAQQMRAVIRDRSRLGHLALWARLRMSVLSITARKRITPWKVKVQFESHCAKTIPSCTMPSIAAPKNVPMTEPKPPASKHRPSRR